MPLGIIKQLADRLYTCKALERAAARLDDGRDVVVAAPLSVRPLLVAAGFARAPRPLLVVVSGEEAAGHFARELGVWLGSEAVLRLPLLERLPWLQREPDLQELTRIAQRARALSTLAGGRPQVVVASARALLRCLPQAEQGAFAPLRLSCGLSACLPQTGEVVELAELPAWLAGRGYERLERLEQMGQFSLHGDVLDIWPASLSHPVRVEFFDDEVEIIRRIVPATGQTIGTVTEIDIYPACEAYVGPEPLRQRAAAQSRRASRGQADDEVTNAHFAEPQLPAAAVGAADAVAVEIASAAEPATGAEQAEPGVGSEPNTAAAAVAGRPSTPLDYLPADSLICLVEPRSLFEDCARYYEEATSLLPISYQSPAGFFVSPGELDFGAHQRLTLLSLLSSGTDLDARIEVKHPDIAGSDERLASTAQSLLAGGYLCLAGIPDRRAREQVELALSDAHVGFEDVRSLASVESNNTARLAEAEGVPPLMSVPSFDSTGSAAELAASRLKQSSLPNPPVRNSRSRSLVATPSASASPAVLFDSSLPSSVLISDLDIPQPLSIPAAKLALLSLNDAGARAAARRGRGRGRARKAIDPTSVTFPFKPGDYVVHATHGIALFKAIVRQEIAGVERDYLHLEYAAGDKLFTPVEQIDKITRYVGPESSSPRLTRLHTADWSRATGKARKAARKLAFDLVDLYARRSTAKGYSYAPDNDQQYQMELAFPYEETPDQLAAIADVKADMESERPMDRLICGDVGFGKTEVALRAAFKAVQSGRQVMLLCPTTILAQQHYTTFYERFDPFAVNVQVLSRFRSSAQQRQTLEDFAAGKVDVLVGTHRLLSADVNPHNLGLIIIDEEQRFGVQHKEQLKNLREQVDVLTLSATPIPRTMQMAISGVRDMSLIDTPPASRTPIKVHVGEWDEDVVSAAIRLEMERGGQVYYVSNRVKSIDDAVARVVATAPEARIGVAHGQMSPTQLEAVMEQFSANQYDVLVATTIIESGLDNPHTNTLIIEDSQRLGLAQLYQLKGRVGRSHAQAFAYFLFPSQSQLTEEAVERLTAIDEFQGLGSGMKIAMRDLEIRGAGSLLGAEQHGMLSAVGFDLFASMLAEAVRAARAGGGSAAGSADAVKDGVQTSTPEVRIDLPVPYFLPEEYVPAADERVLWYRRLQAATDADTVRELADQLLHAFGALPQVAQNLVDRSMVRVLAAELGITSIHQQRGKLVFEPLELSADEAAAYKRQGALYLAKTLRLSIPPQPGIPLLQATIAILENLLTEAEAG
ncbi:MAG: transcription-repair coupling factor [Coriobacteriales bacterium]|jgi:transcription-repair coupling factor (superfamily II helicase)|nr:transcription-repair coupling factor [Coriobacteriales bacterium]